MFLKGVNIGAAKPGYFPGEFGITKSDYKRWFKQIKEMNSNVIRIYTLHNPVFYEALYEFNKHTKEPLYLIQGVWVNEETMKEEENAFSSKVIDIFKMDISKVIDALHGNINIEQEPGQAYGNYTKNVSPYVLGYILGTEWDPTFVEETNKKNKDLEDFNGEWLYTENATPIEVFFANVGDYTIEYETNTYKEQRPIAFSNWLTTDILDHKDEVDEANRIVNIDENKIKFKSNFMGGLFVSYHIYPYYPDFLNYDEKYSTYIDENEQKNSYEAYLKDLIKNYKDKPVVVSEFGVPESRGITHEDLSRGFNQGMVNESQQGEMNKAMIEDIYSNGYAGAIIFSWQDEWFKRTWNTMDMDDSEGRPFWGDRLTNEQYFGLLSFEPGKKKVASYVDGKVKEWKKKDLISKNDNMKLYMKSDEEYIYFRINKENLDLNKEEILIPIDINPNLGSNMIQGYKGEFSKQADFVISIKGKNNSSILVNEYYDTNEFLFHKKEYTDKNSSKFNLIKQTTFGESITPITNKYIPHQEFPIGNLIYGNTNPNRKDYNSIADFIVNKNDIEIRIPWLMLNISNPAKKTIIDDFYENKDIKHIEIKNINVGVSLVKNKVITDSIEMKGYSWDKWMMPTYHERLKQSYYYIQDMFEEIE
ncbi:MAG: family 2 glycosyl transferase [Romboutsia sp.]|nr:family 2 glycosyl transferase [Romboutsia sp.]